MDQFSDPFAATITFSDGEAQRNAARDSLLLIAKLRLPDGREVDQVRVRNLSEGGLMAESHRLKVDMSIEVEVRGIGWVPGTVAWVAEGRAGIAFSRKIDPKRARKPVGRANKGG